MQSIARSSNGRTTDSGSVYLGSSPSLAALQETPHSWGFLLHTYMKHTMQLQPTPFEQILAGTKTIEIRLNDDKRKRICVGDIIIFSHAATNETIAALVTALHQFLSFADLYSAFPAVTYGGTGNDDPSAMYNYYSPEDEAALGVLGIEIKVVHE